MSTGSDQQIPKANLGIHGVRNHLRHALAFLVAWWFFAEVIPVFTTIHANRGLTASVPTTLAVFLSTLAVLYGAWLLPVLLCGDFALGRAVQRIGGIQWRRRWATWWKRCSARPSSLACWLSAG